MVQFDADGWHMSSHAVAIGLSAFADAAARRYVGDTRCAFGTWKIEVLAGFASARRRPMREPAMKAIATVLAGLVEKSLLRFHCSSARPLLFRSSH